MRLRHTVRPLPARPAIAVAAAIASAAVLGAAPASAADATPPTTGGVEVRVAVADNPAEVVTTDAQWPAGVLADAGVEMTPNDRILVFREGRVVAARQRREVHAADTIKVVRISRDVHVTRAAIKPHTVVTKTTSIAPGRRKVVADGRPGVRQTRVIRWIRNGEHVDTDVSRRVVREPAPRRVLLGVRARTVPGTGHLNWRALANCESSGNPHAVNPAGYYGLYQFSIGTWHSVGGQGIPSQASPAEQTYRAQRLYAQRGRSPWPVCGRLL